VFLDCARLCSPPAEQQGRLTEGLIDPAYEYPVHLEDVPGNGCGVVGGKFA
jgi:hypothetical protein